MTQKDTLRTIAACLPVYGPDNALAFSSEIWEALKVEVRMTGLFRFQPLESVSR